eukprot:296582-Amphidinium_carterae.1
MDLKLGFKLTCTSHSFFGNSPFDLDPLQDGHGFTRTRNAQINSEFDKEKYKIIFDKEKYKIIFDKEKYNTISESGDPQTLTKTIKHEQVINKSEVLVSRTGPDDLTAIVVTGKDEAVQ